MRAKTVVPGLLFSLTLIAQQSGRIATLQGFVDERPGANYVLRDTQDLKVQAILRPPGNPHALAKYVGQRVEVRGRMVESAETPIIEVKEVTRIPSRGRTATGTGASNSLTGTLEQRGDTYVLVDPFTNKVLASLSPTDTARGPLAEFKGRKVLVEGRLKAAQPAPVLTVDQVRPFPD